MDNFSTSSVDVSNVERNDSVDEQIMYNLLNEDHTIDENRNNILTTWKDTFENYTEMYNKIVDEMCVTYEDLLNTSEYIADLKVPFCWECVRLSFANELHELLEEFQQVDTQISTFTREMHMHRNLSIQRGNIKLSNSAIDFLGNLLGYYAHKSSSIKEDLAYIKKRGQDAFVESQQIYNTCGDETF
jgi:hypothetical protein